MSNTNGRQLLVRAWEAALGAIEDGVISLDEENAPSRYTDHFGLTQEDTDRNGAHTTIVQAAVIREIIQGIVPKRQNINGPVPFNLMKSEKLVWVIQDVDYFGDGGAAGAPGHLPRGQHPRRPGSLLSAQHLPQPAHRVGRYSTRRHRDAISRPSISTSPEAGSGSGSGTRRYSPQAPTRTGSGSCGTSRQPSPSASSRATAGSPTTWLPTWPSSRAEPGHTSAAGDPTTGARWLRKQQGNLASTVTPNLQTCLSRAVKSGNPIPGNGPFPIGLSGVTGGRLVYYI